MLCAGVSSISKFCEYYAAPNPESAILSALFYNAPLEGIIALITIRPTESVRSYPRRWSRPMTGGCDASPQSLLYG